MASFNRVILVGNLTRDPQLSYTPSNTPVCEFGLAMNRRYRDRDGNQKEEVCYVDVNAYGRTAETINQYMRKGRPILVEGRLRYRQWTNKEGQNRSKLDVTVDTFSFLDSGGGGAGGGAGGAGAAGGNRPAARPAPSSVADDGPPADDAGPPPDDADIPF
jgi:single-strand DNA-binding protein